MIINGDSFEELKKLEDNSVDSIITDPPYDIGFMGKKWDKKSLITNVDFWKECLRVLKPGGHLLSFGHSRTSHRMVTAVEEAGFEIRDTIMWMYGSGFPKSHNVAIAIDKKLGKMGHRGKEFDTGAKDAYDKPKRKMTAIEQHQAISEEAKEWQGWGTALKPAYEPITMARKPLEEKNVAENIMKWGTGGINIDESRVGTEKIITNGKGNKFVDNLPHGERTGESVLGVNIENIGRFPANIILDKTAGELLDDQSGPTKASFVRNKTDGARPFNNEGEATNYTSEKINVEEDGKGASRYFKSIDTELCGSLEQQEHKEPQGNVEPITVARKPLEGTVADNVMKYGTGALNIDESRVGTEKIVSHHAPKGTFAGGEENRGSDKNYYTSTGRFPANIILDQETGELLDQQAPKVGNLFSAKRTKDTTGGSGDSWTTGKGGNKVEGSSNGHYDELGGASRFFKKIENEPITVARKPLEGTVADNVLQYGTGALNIDATRVQGEPIQKNVGYKEDNQSEGWGTKKCITEVQEGGRFPANVILDEEAGELLDSQTEIKKQGKQLVTKHSNQDRGYRQEYVNGEKTGSKGEVVNYHDGGGASRFFYCAKVSTKERKINCENIESKGGEKGNGLGRVCETCGVSQLKAEDCKCENKSWVTRKTQGRNTHPTVKPVKLMEYLVKLVTKRGGVVLDPFAGSGSTGVACKNLGMKYIMIEREAEYCEIIKARLS